MAARRKAGLSIGQSLTLAFGFLLGSVIIFAFGIWVGRDLAQQRQRQERPVVFKPIDKTAVPTGAAAKADAPSSTPEVVVGVQTGDAQPDERPTRPRLAAFTPEVPPMSPPTPTATRRLPPTATPALPISTVVAQPRQPVAPPGGAVWTVQATATNDQVQAVVTARGLRAKGFDAYTVQADVGGVPWYRIQVGKFADKQEADRIAARLRREGLEAAFVDRLR